MNAAVLLKKFRMGSSRGGLSNTKEVVESHAEDIATLLLVATVDTHLVVSENRDPNIVP